MNTEDVIALWVYYLFLSMFLLVVFETTLGFIGLVLSTFLVVIVITEKRRATFDNKMRKINEDLNNTRKNIEDRKYKKEENENDN